MQHKDLRSVQKQAGRGSASSSGHAATSSPPSARKPLSDEIIQQFLASARRMADECAARNGSPRSADAGNAAFGAARASSHSEDAMAGSVGTANPCPAKDASGSSLSAHVPQTSIKDDLISGLPEDPLSQAKYLRLRGTSACSQNKLKEALALYTQGLLIQGARQCGECKAAKR